MKTKHIIINLSATALMLGALGAAWKLGAVDFFDPIWLLGLAVLPVFTWLAATGRAGLPPGMNTASSIVRNLLFAIIVCCLADIRIMKTNNDVAVFFLLDRSASIRDRDPREELDYINALTAEKKPHDRAGIIVFGHNASVEQMPEQNLFLSSKLHSFIDTDQTDIQAAIELAAAAMPEDARRKIVLITDGNETKGDLLEGIRYAAGHGIITDIKTLNYDYEKEVVMEKIYLPDRIKVNETFEVKVHIKSLANTTGQLTILKDGALMAEQEVNLHKGDNTFSQLLKLDDPGFHAFSARITAEGDTISRNNTGDGYVYIQGESKILFVAPGKSEVSHLMQACVEDNLKAEFMPPESLPDSLAQLQNYDCIVLANVPADAMTEEQMLMLQANVRDLGVGLVMIGGQDSFGAGNYDHTPIEDVLPVTMDIKQKKIIPKGALALVLHTCEFPRGNFWAKEITKRAIETVSPQDDVGVLMYGGREDEWLFPLMSAENKDVMYDKINQAFPGDMPSFGPAMQSAYDGLKVNDAMVKHMIIISDGDPAAPRPQLIKDMAAAGITISTVGINPHSPRDTQLLQYIARQTGGTYYFAQNPAQLPRIFIKEAKVVKRSLVFDKEFQPLLALSTELTKGIQANELPSLQAYVATTAKPRALVPIVSDNDNEDPILAYWRYGLGKSVAFTSDATGNWGKNWVTWGKYKRIWTQVLRWSSRKREKSNLHVRTEMNGQQGKLIIDAIDKDGSYINFLKLNSRLVDPDNAGKTLHMRQTAPGRYESAFDASKVGINILNVAYANPATGGQGFLAMGIPVPYSPEYRRLESNRSLLIRAAEVGGGKLLQGIPEMDRVFDTSQQTTHSSQPIWEILLLVSLGLFFTDVVMRRVIFTREDLRTALNNMSLARQRRRTGDRDDTMDALLKRKKKTFEHESKEAPSAPARFQQALQSKAKDTRAIPDIQSEIGQAPSASATPSKKSKTTKTSVGAAEDEEGGYTNRLLAAKRRARKKTDNQDTL